MAKCRQHMFSPKVGEEFVGEILYRRKGRAETDHDLYFDGGIPTLFVITTESPCGGSSHDCTHTRYSLDEYLGAHPAYRQRVVDILHERMGHVLEQRVGQSP
jgi:hypothetical protein